MSSVVCLLDRKLVPVKLNPSDDHRTDFISVCGICFLRPTFQCSHLQNLAMGEQLYFEYPICVSMNEQFRKLLSFDDLSLLAKLRTYQRVTGTFFFYSPLSSILSQLEDLQHFLLSGRKFIWVRYKIFTFHVKIYMC